MHLKILSMLLRGRRNSIAMDDFITKSEVNSLNFANYMLMGHKIINENNSFI
jgi:hypothetical protein